MLRRKLVLTMQFQVISSESVDCRTVRTTDSEPEPVVCASSGGLSCEMGGE